MASLHSASESARTQWPFFLPLDRLFWTYHRQTETCPGSADYFRFVDILNSSDFTHSRHAMDGDNVGDVGSMSAPVRV